MLGRLLRDAIQHRAPRLRHDAEEASIALGVPLVYHSGKPGSEIYLAYGSPGIPGFYPSDSALALQFRKGQLTGWKKDWRLRRPWPF